MRYQTLLQQKLDAGVSFRELSRETKIGVGSLADYIQQGVIPRLEALRRLSEYFQEPISVLIDEDDDLTAELITHIRQLPPNEKRTLLESVKIQLVHNRSIIDTSETKTG